MQDIYQYDYGDFSDNNEKSGLNILDINEDISENLVDSGGYNSFQIFHLASTWYLDNNEKNFHVCGTFLQD